MLLVVSELLLLDFALFVHINRRPNRQRQTDPEQSVAASENAQGNHREGQPARAALVVFSRVHHFPIMVGMV